MSQIKNSMDTRVFVLVFLVIVVLTLIWVITN